MFLFLKIYLLLISLYHILNTIFVYWIFDWSYWMNFSSTKDLIWFVFIFMIILSNIRWFKQFVVKYKNIVFGIVLLIIWAIWISIICTKSISDIIIWFKYDLLYLLIFFSSIYLWYKSKNIEKSKIEKYIKFVFYLLIFVVVFWFFWQLAKYVYPKVFYNLWYGRVWDYVAGESPPIYYRTWSWGVSRLSWIFSWPNNYWYFMILFFSFFVTYISHLSISKFWKKICMVWYGVFSFLTLSRWVIVWQLFQIYYFFSQKILISKKKMFVIVGIIIVWLLFFSYYKYNSTLLHFKNTLSAVQFFIQNPIWYWLGSSGPSIHYNGYLLPENMFLQILIDLWLPWFILWIYIFISILKIQSYKDLGNDLLWKILKSFYIWLFSLFFVWLFLHVFEDSMVNYLFFINFWFLLWYYSQTIYQKKI